MSKKVLVISTSLRAKSNSETLADAFADGAKAAGNEVEKISLKNKSIAFCKGCLACQSLHSCIIKDDAVHLAGTIFAGGVSNAGEMEGHPSVKKAYDMGASIR